MGNYSNQNSGRSEPTEKQLNYARDLGVNVPPGASLEDVSCLIDRAIAHDSDPNPGLIAFAIGRGLNFSDYIGKKRLYNEVFHKLSQRDRIAFFAFSIYRYLSEDREANLDASPYKDVFYQFADSVIDDEKFNKSLSNYSGAQLRFFGTLRVNDRSNYNDFEGGSKQTIAYKTAFSFLSEKLSIVDSGKKVLNTSSKKTAPSSYTNFLPAPGSKSKSITLILCIFLGFLGIHRFYVGKTGSGLLYLFTAGLLYVGWIKDIISIVSGNFRDSNGAPLIG